MDESRWERIIVSVSATVIAAGIVGLYVLMMTLSQNQAVMQTQMQGVRTTLHDAYSQRAAEQAFAEVERRDAMQDRKLEDHEERLRAVERGRIIDSNQ